MCVLEKLGLTILRVRRNAKTEFKCVVYSFGQVIKSRHFYNFFLFHSKQKEQTFSQKMSSSSSQQISVLDVPVDSDARAVGIMMQFLDMANKRGAFGLEESGKIMEAIGYLRRGVPRPEAPPQEQEEQEAAASAQALAEEKKKPPAKPKLKN